MSNLAVYNAVTAINTAVAQKKILFIESGTYVVTSKISIPARVRITGEAYPTFLVAGAFFSEQTKPQTLLQVGKPGETGTVEWTDTMVSGRGAVAGAIFIEHNLASGGPVRTATWTDHSETLYGPSGLWDVHFRVGGFAGSDLLIVDCPVDRTTAVPPAPVPSQCIAGFMSTYITSTTTNLQLDVVWLWTADHDIEDPELWQITSFNGRRPYISQPAGPLCVWGTAVANQVIYEYQLAGVKEIFVGEIQTEMAHYQSNPPTTLPFPALAEWNDPMFLEFCYTAPGFNYAGPSTTFSNSCDGFGLCVIDASENVLVYGTGLYSFFVNNNVSCAPVGMGLE